MRAGTALASVSACSRGHVATERDEQRVLGQFVGERRVTASRTQEAPQADLVFSYEGAGFHVLGWRTGSGRQVRKSWHTWQSPGRDSEYPEKSIVVARPSATPAADRFARGDGLFAARHQGLELYVHRIAAHDPVEYRGAHGGVIGRHHAEAL